MLTGYIVRLDVSLTFKMYGFAFRIRKLSMGDNMTTASSLSELQ